MRLIDDIVDFMSDRPGFSPPGLARELNETFPGPRRFMARQLIEYSKGKRPDFPQERAEQLAYVLSRYGYKPPPEVKAYEVALSKPKLVIESDILAQGIRRKKPELAQ